MPLMATDTSLVATAPKFILISIIGIISYVVASYFLSLEEVQPIIDFVKKTLFKNLK
jgi:hypothetical protein